jgi:two-component system response regulator TctD
VLEALVLRAGATVSKSALTQTVFGVDDEANPNAIEIYVHRLRKKLAGSDIEIVTQRGLGYVLKHGR